MSGTSILTARSQAYLFGLIAKAIIDTFGEAGTEVIARGVTRYGEQRGGRMAQRTAADGLESTALNYVLYGEWSAEPGEMDVAIPAKNPDIQYWIKKCPWHDVWTEQGLLEKYGYLYCKYVDVALARGYNPELQFDILTNRGQGNAVCDMRLRNANVTEAEDAEFAVRAQKLGNKAKMPWDYHCAHLFKTLWESVAAAFGSAGVIAIQGALLEFETVQGREASTALLALMETDFNVAPPYVGINS